MSLMAMIEMEFKGLIGSLPKFVYINEPPLMPALLSTVDVVADVEVMAGFITMAPVVPAVVYSLILLC